uniref:Gypsy retrotransposon integrase-like protein 1 n=1 Tax=Astyanax mexicanus TaxID=7994 RepID=A0A3B1J1Z4_ASTMX
MIDSGSMACTLSESAESSLLQQNPDMVKYSADDIIIFGCGGQSVTPKALYNVEMTVYDCRMLIPVLVVPGQTDDVILGSNAIKALIQWMRKTDSYWRIMSESSVVGDDDLHQFLSLISNTERWRGESVPERVGTLRLKQCISLQPRCEHLVWGKLPESAAISVGSTVIVEPTQSRCRPKNVLVGRVITPMWGDRWLPMKLINPSSEVVVLKRNAKLADVFPCIAVEDLSQPDSIQSYSQCVLDTPLTRSGEEVKMVLEKLGLQELDLDACEVSDVWRDRLLQIIERYESIFSRGKMDCGEATGFVHKIHLIDDKPFRLPYRRVPPSQYEKLRTALNEMEEKGIIRKSHSEYASPLVLVWKKNGDLRICTDFRWLNAKTVKDAHPLPHQADALAALGGNVFFSTMDLTSGFYNVPLHEQHKKYTAFSSPFGLHEYNRMAQGLSNSPATFMRMMLAIFGDENFTSVLCYLDDLMTFAPTEQLALERLEMILSRLKNHNLKLAPKKCNFLRRSVKFLGHVICETGVQTDPSKVEAISQIQKSDLMESDGVTPSQKKIRSFLGMVLYYQHFIEDCSAKARPLFKLTSEQRNQGKAQRGRKPYKRKPVSVKLSADDWSSECQNAFDTLKHDLTHSVTLAHPDFNEPFILAVDASFDGIGAVLSQIPPGETVARPVAFASKTLSRSQLNYPAHRLEFLALKWAITDKFSHWLKGRHFTAWSDNNPLTYILTKPKLDACEQRWVAKLAAYDFDLKYVPGTKNTVADALSREPFVQSCISHRLVKEPYTSLLDEVNGVVTGTVQDAFRLTTNCLIVDSQNESEDDPVLMQDPLHSAGFSVSAEEVSAVLDAHRNGGISQLPCVSPASLQLPQEDPSIVIPHSQLLSLQEQDATVSRVLYYVQRGKKPTRHEKETESTCVTRLLKHWKKLKVRNGILYRVKRHRHLNRKVFQFIIPESLKKQVLHGVHDAAGHQGCARTLSLACERFFWTGMNRDVAYYVKHCQRCIVGKTPEPDARAPLKNIRTSEPMELVCIDFWTAELSDRKTVDVLVVTDHFTKMAHAFHCRNQSAKQVARRLWNDFFCVYGFPKRIHSDQGANFESRLIKDLLEMAGVQKSHTTPYHPMGNGISERFNRTLGNMIRALPPKCKSRWPQMLQTLTFSYNCTVHETTGFAPFYLMFGRVPRLPIDVMFQNILENDRVELKKKKVKKKKKS